MAGYLLDTNVISHLVRSPKSPPALRVAALASRPCTSIVVVAEMRFGIAKSGSTKLEGQLERVLYGIDILPFTAPVDRVYGRLRAELERSGRLIGPNDLLIAAQCLAGDLTLVTDSVREFERVPGLRLENWLR